LAGDPRQLRSHLERVTGAGPNLAKKITTICGKSPTAWMDDTVYFGQYVDLDLVYAKLRLVF
jgi:hypothetical protein